MSHGTPIVPVMQEPGFAGIYGVATELVAVKDVMSDAMRTADLQWASSYLGEEQAHDLYKRADAYFDATYVASQLGFLQALAREEWKDENGTYSRWDRVAHRAGVFAVGRVILGR